MTITFWLPLTNLSVDFNWVFLRLIRLFHKEYFKTFNNKITINNMIDNGIQTINTGAIAYINWYKINPISSSICFMNLFFIYFTFINPINNFGKKRY